MRPAVLILPLLLSACAPAMTETVVIDEENVAGSAVAVAGDDALPAVLPSPRPCVDRPGQYDSCLTGKRGTPDKPCFEVTAYLQKPGARDVYAEPDKSSKRLGQILGIPPSEEGRPVPFEVLDSRDGWLLIEGAADDPDLSGVDRPMYHGRGWIRGEGVGVSAQAEQVFAKPDFDSQIVAEGGWFDGIPPIRIMGCDGSWVHARWPMPRSPDNRFTYRPEAVVSRDPVVIEGWVTGICGIMETTCDGLDGNRPTR